LRVTLWILQMFRLVSHVRPASQHGFASQDEHHHTKHVGTGMQIQQILMGGRAHYLPSHMVQDEREAPLASQQDSLRYPSAVMMFSKTVLYWFQEYYCGFCAIGHNTTKDLMFLWIVPNGCVPCLLHVVTSTYESLVVCSIR